MIDLLGVLVNGIAAGAVMALVALGFGIIHKVSQFFHLSHGAIITIAGYVAYILLREASSTIIAAGIVSAVIVGGLGVLLNQYVYLRLRQRRASSMTLLLASLGIFIVLQNAVSVLFGDQTVLLRESALQDGIMLGGIRFIPTQIGNIVVGGTACLIVTIALRFTNIGRDFRATADNAELAAALGVNVNLVQNYAFATGSALAGLASVATAYDANLNPGIGLRILLPGATAYILAGGRRVEGAIVGALLIGLLTNVTGWWLPIRWQDSVVFLLLVGGLVAKSKRAV